MPQNYWGHVIGLPDASVTDTTATTAGADVEIRYDLDASMTRPQVIESIERIMNYVKSKDTWPPI